MEKWLPVSPKNYRKIALYAIRIAENPIVLLNHKQITDYAENAALTQKNICKLIDFEIRDGSKKILGFHDHPDEMWITDYYSNVAIHCSQMGWLKIQG